MTMYPINLHPPSENDWRSEVWCLDAQAAYRDFSGKSLQEAESLFKENAIRYQERLMFMPSICFLFYIVAYLDYLDSEDSAGDSDAANCFLGLVECRLAELAQVETLCLRVCQTLTAIGDRQAWYDADEALYGSFAEKASILIQQMNTLLQENAKRRQY